jgi:long-chain acyl-CoA synthetase
VFGDNRKSIVALIVPNRGRVESCARDRGVVCDSYGTLLEHYAVREILGNEVKEANAESASYERVTSFTLLSEPFTMESGTLTPTLKVRRKRIAETCTDLIEALYDRMEGGRAH